MQNDGGGGDGGSLAIGRVRAWGVPDFELEARVLAVAAEDIHAARGELCKLRAWEDLWLQTGCELCRERHLRQATLLRAYVACRLLGERRSLAQLRRELEEQI